MDNVEVISSGEGKLRDLCGEIVYISSRPNFSFYIDEGRFGQIMVVPDGLSLGLSNGYYKVLRSFDTRVADQDMVLVQKLVFYGESSYYRVGTKYIVSADTAALICIESLVPFSEPIDVSDIQKGDIIKLIEGEFIVESGTRVGDLPLTLKVTCVEKDIVRAEVIECFDGLGACTFGVIVKVFKNRRIVLERINNKEFYEGLPVLSEDYEHFI
jgi:hypothetical protein